MKFEINRKNLNELLKSNDMELLFEVANKLDFLNEKLFLIFDNATDLITDLLSIESLKDGIEEYTRLVQRSQRLNIKNFDPTKKLFFDEYKDIIYNVTDEYIINLSKEVIKKQLMNLTDNELFKINQERN